LADNGQSGKAEARKANVKEIAGILRSTETMAAQFAKRVQERVGEQVSYADILDAMRKMSAKRLTMGKVVSKVRRESS
jgi:hypothetical protein